jgi:hypothetical protein
MISQQTTISAPILPTPVELPTINEKKDDLLLDIDEDKAIEHVNNTSTKVLEDLNDLKFEQNDFLEIEPAGMRILLQDLFWFLLISFRFNIRTIGDNTTATTK